MMALRFANLISVIGIPAAVALSTPTFAADRPPTILSHQCTVAALRSLNGIPDAHIRSVNAQGFIGGPKKHQLTSSYIQRAVIGGEIAVSVADFKFSLHYGCPISTSPSHPEEWALDGPVATSIH